MRTIERRRVTTRAMIDVGDRMQRALAHAHIRLDDLDADDAIPFLQEALVHAQTVAALIEAKVKDIESTRVVS